MRSTIRSHVYVPGPRQVSSLSLHGGVEWQLVIGEWGKGAWCHIVLTRVWRWCNLLIKQIQAICVTPLIKLCKSFFFYLKNTVGKDLLFSDIFKLKIDIILLLICQLVPYKVEWSITLLKHSNSFTPFIF